MVRSHMRAVESESTDSRASPASSKSVIAQCVSEKRISIMTGITTAAYAASGLEGGGSRIVSGPGWRRRRRKRGGARGLQVEGESDGMRNRDRVARGTAGLAGGTDSARRGATLLVAQQQTLSYSSVCFDPPRCRLELVSSM